MSNVSKPAVVGFALLALSGSSTTGASIRQLVRGHELGTIFVCLHLCWSPICGSRTNYAEI